MFRILFAVLPFIYLAGNGYLYWRTLQLMSSLPLWSKVAVSVLFWTAAFSLFISLALRNAGVSDLLLRILYMAGSIWMVFLLYCVILLAAFDVARIFWPVLGPGLKYAAPLAACVLVAGYVIYIHPKVERLEIVLDKPMKDLTVVAVSDVHLGHGTGVKALKKYVGMINSQNPDVVVVAGDLIDNSVQPLLNAPFAEILDSIDAPDGIYMVPGNHEYISGIVLRPCREDFNWWDVTTVPTGTVCRLICFLPVRICQSPYLYSTISLTAWLSPILLAWTYSSAVIRIVARYGL